MATPRDSDTSLNEDSTDTDAVLSILKYDNEQLTTTVGTLEDKVDKCEKDIECMKSYLVRTCEQNNLLKNRIRDLEATNMKCSFLILHAKENSKEDAIELAVRLILEDKLNVERADFVSGRRLGLKRDGKVRPILMTCPRSDVAQFVIDHYKKLSKRRNGIKIIPFIHNEYRENRSRMHTLAKELKIKGARVEVKNDHIIANNQKMKDQVVPPSDHNVLFMSKDDQALVSQVKFVQSKTKTEDFSSFTLFMTPVTTPEQARIAYAAMASNPSVIRSSHLITAYRLPDGMGTYRDDGDYGMGLQLFNGMDNRKVTGSMCFLVRKYGGKHLGPRRFKIVLELLDEVENSIRLNGDFKAMFDWVNVEKLSPANKRFKHNNSRTPKGHTPKSAHKQHSQGSESILNYMVQSQGASSQVQGEGEGKKDSQVQGESKKDSQVQGESKKDSIIRESSFTQRRN